MLHLGIFYMPQITTWDRRLYVPSEGRRAEDFLFALKNPTASAGFEPANLGTKGQHATCRPPKLLCVIIVYCVMKVSSCSPPLECWQ